MSRPAELLLDLVVLAAVVWLAWRFVAVLWVAGTFLLVTVALMVFERTVR